MGAGPVDGLAAGLAAGFGLGPIDQIGFAVADLDAALPAYAAIFGEFTRRDSTFTPERVRYRGEPSSAELALAFARSGELEIELVEIRKGDGPAAQHIREYGAGLHHVRFTVADIEAKCAAMEAAGFEKVLSGISPRGSRFAYFEKPEQFGHTQFELLQEPRPAGF